MTDIVVILNPTAGNLETVRDWQERVESMVGRSPVRISSHAGEAEALARRAVEEGFGRVVAAGGDGTVNHVANGIAGSDAALGILPMGTVNVFAMELGLPANDLERCWEIVAAGHTHVSLIYRVRMENILSNSVALGSMRKPSKKPLLRSSAVLAR